MSDLTLIWTVSLFLAAAALIWMAVLIGARLRRTRNEARRERARALIRQAFLDIMTGGGDAIGRLRTVRRRARVMAEALLEVSALVRGSERERLIGALQAFGVDQTLQRRLGRGSTAGRMVAAEALAIFRGEATVAALRTALTRARGADLRVGLMRSLIELGAPVSLGQALDDLQGRRASDSLLYLPLIARLTADDPEAAMAAFVAPETRGEARAILAEALGGSGDYRALAPLVEAAQSPDLELRIAAIRGLTALRHPAAEPAVLAGLTDPVWIVRAAACEAAGRIGLPSTIPALAAQLEDDVWWVRFRAGEALAALGEAGADRLRKLAVEGGDLSSRAASMALAERGLAMEAA